MCHGIITTCTLPIQRGHYRIKDRIRGNPCTRTPYVQAQGRSKQNNNIPDPSIGNCQNNILKCTSDYYAMTHMQTVGKEHK